MDSLQRRRKVRLLSSALAHPPSSAPSLARLRPPAPSSCGALRVASRSPLMHLPHPPSSPNASPPAGARQTVEQHENEVAPRTDPANEEAAPGSEAVLRRCGPAAAECDLHASHRQHCARHPAVSQDGARRRRLGEWRNSRSEFEFGMCVTTDRSIGACAAPRRAAAYSLRHARTHSRATTAAPHAHARSCSPQFSAAPEAAWAPTRCAAKRSWSSRSCVSSTSLSTSRRSRKSTR